MERKNKRTKSVGNGEGSLYYSEKLKIWIYQYTHNGSRKSIKQHKGEQAKEFKKRVTALKNSLNNGCYVENNNTTVIELGKQIIDNKFKRNKVSEASYKRLTYTLRHIEESSIANIQLQKITSTQLQNFIDTQTNYSNSIINKTFSLLNKIFITAIQQDIIIKNPMINIEKPKSEKRDKNIDAFSIEEQKSFLLHIKKEQYKNIFLILLYSGMRVGEILALKREDVDLKNKIIHIRRTLTKDLSDKTVLGEVTKTYMSTRDIPITHLFENEIQTAMNNMIINPNNLLFVQSSGKLISTSMINSAFKRVCYKMGLKVKYYKKKKGTQYFILPTSDCNTHMLRHTYATRCIEAGIPAEVLQKLLGHKNIDTTIDTYTTIFDKFKDKQVEKYVAYIESI